MNLRALKLFCDVVGRRSFSKAADENGISQSGASQVIHQLEDHLGVKLIDRSKRPFVLTEEGEVYYEGCRKLVQRYFALEEKVCTLHREVSGRVTVASIYSVGLSHMNRYVQEFFSRHPKANVRLEYQHPDKVYELVENDHVDMGLVSYPKSSRTIDVITWREEPMVLVCAPQHALAQNSSISLAELDGQNLIGFDPQLRIRREIDRELEAHDAHLNVVMEFDNIETMKRAIEIDAGVGFLPEPTIAREVETGSLVSIPLRGVEMVRPLGIILRRGKQLGETASSFMRFLKTKADEPLLARAAASVRAAEAGESPVLTAPINGSAVSSTVSSGAGGNGRATAIADAAVSGAVAKSQP